MIKAHILTREKIEQAATNLLEDYYGTPVTQISDPLDIEDLIENHLKLDFEMDDLSAREGQADVHGALYVDERLIRIDYSLDPVEYPHLEGRYRYTCGHEVGHWELHRHKLEKPDNGQLSLLTATESKPSTLCRVSETPQNYLVERDWIEWQADAYSAALLMPKPLIHRDYESLWLPVAEPLTDAWRLKEWQYWFIPTLAKKYKVSKMAMGYRLQTLHLAAKPTHQGLFQLTIATG